MPVEAAAATLNAIADQKAVDVRPEIRGAVRRTRVSREALGDRDIE